MLRRLLVMTVVVGSLAAASPSLAQAAWSVDGWGENHFGQLGDGTSTGPEKCGSMACSRTLVAAKGLSEIVTAVAAGEGDSLALLKNGTVMSWGANESGQLGNGATKSSTTPVKVCAVEGCSHGALKGVTAVTAGNSHNLALLSNGKVVAWGNNADGQLGNKTTTSSSLPIEVSGLSEVVAIAAGHQFGLALLSSGRVMAWGLNSSGQLGDGTSSGPESCGSSACSKVPVEVSGLSELPNGVKVTAMSGGGGYGLALVSNGTVRAWGANEDGQLGNGTTTNSTVPVQTNNLSGNVTKVAAGGEHSLALLGNGAVMAWGLNSSGQLGDGTSSGPESCGGRACSTTPVETSAMGEVVSIAAGNLHSLAFLRNGTASAWGNNEDGQLGNGTITSSDVPVAVSSPPSKGAFEPGSATISASGRHSQAVVSPARCSPDKPAAQALTITSTSIGTLHISWTVGATSPSREWVSYWSEKQSLQTHSAETELENGKARSTELTNLRPGEPYKVALALEYSTCVEDSLEAGSNDVGIGWSLAPTVHFYMDLSTEERAGPEELFPPGEVVLANFGQFGEHEEVHSYTDLPTIKGNTSHYVDCQKLDSDWTFVDPKEGTATWKIENWSPSECSQVGYCAAGEAVSLELKPLNVEIDTYLASNGYRFSHFKPSFTVTCNGKAVANIVESKELNNGVLGGYWSNGRYAKTDPPNLDLGDGGQYGETYGNGGDMELEGSGGQQVIQPHVEWYYLGYENFAGDVIPSESP